MTQIEEAGGAFTRCLTPGRCMRYKLTIAYDGTDFHGWQKQHPPGEEPLRTVQGIVEYAVMQVTRQPVVLMGASRTDAGVHAKGQTGSFEADTPIPISRLADAINSRLPDDVEVRDAEIVHDGFNVIGDVVTKQYRYSMFNTSRKPLLHRRAFYHCWLTLDPVRMNDAAAKLVGTHDFAGFAAANHGRESTVRTIHRCEVETFETFDGYPVVSIIVEGDGFLYNMVRIIAGTLVEVGRGHFEPGWINEIIASGTRQDAGPTLPPEGLSLEWMKYKEPPATVPESAVHSETEATQTELEKGDGA